MIDIITGTSTLSDIDSIQTDLEQFMICHYYQTPLYVSEMETYMNHLTVYFKDGMDESELEDLEEAYGSEKSFKFKFNGVTCIREAMDKIVNRLEHTIDRYEESVDVIIAMEPTPSRILKSYFNKQCRDRNISAEAMSLLNYNQLPSLDALTDSMKKLFHTDFIYQEDPIQYAYICRKYYEGGYK